MTVSFSRSNEDKLQSKSHETCHSVQGLIIMCQNADGGGTGCSGTKALYDARYLI